MAVVPVAIWTVCIKSRNKLNQGPTIKEKTNIRLIVGWIAAKVHRPSDKRQGTMGGAIWMP